MFYKINNHILLIVWKYFLWWSCLVFRFCFTSIYITIICFWGFMKHIEKGQYGEDIAVEFWKMRDTVLWSGIFAGMWGRSMLFAIIMAY